VWKNKIIILHDSICLIPDFVPASAFGHINKQIVVASSMFFERPESGVTFKSDLSQKNIFAKRMLADLFLNALRNYPVTLE
jgi:hypothetical protein